MSLLKTLFSILALWCPAFCKEAAFVRAKELAIACLCAYGKKQSHPSLFSWGVL